VTRTAVVTGASSGIGEATARRLAAHGYTVVCGARRLERLEALAGEIGGRALSLDVADAASVDAFAAQVPECELLVNNAGGALGMGPVSEADDDQWRWMHEVNVLGLMRMTRALLPRLEESVRGHIVNVTSVSGFEVYEGGGGYTAAKHAAHALSATLRIELLGRPVRVTEVAPGLVETEFSLVRFQGDRAAAQRPYEGMKPLVAGDVADAIAWAVTRPAHVNVDLITLKPLAQATATKVDRRPDD